LIKKIIAQPLNIINDIKALTDEQKTELLRLITQSNLSNYGTEVIHYLLISAIRANCISLVKFIVTCRFAEPELNSRLQSALSWACIPQQDSTDPLSIASALNHTEFVPILLPQLAADVILEYLFFLLDLSPPTDDSMSLLILKVLDAQSAYADLWMLLTSDASINQVAHPKHSSLVAALLERHPELQEESSIKLNCL
jgi:hypothetical protein